MTVTNWITPLKNKIISNICYFNLWQVIESNFNAETVEEI